MLRYSACALASAEGDRGVGLPASEEIADPREGDPGERPAASVDYVYHGGGEVSRPGGARVTVDINS